MPNLSVQLGADTSKLVQGINQAKATLNDYIKAQDKASGSSKESATVTKEQAQAYQSVINELAKVAEGSLSAKQAQKELESSIKELKEQWAALTNEAKSSSFGQSISETMSAAKAELAEMKNSIASIGDVKPGGSLKKELRLTTNELNSLTAQYRAMSSAERESASGQQLAKKMDELRSKAGELKDTIGDVSDEIKVMASDTPNLDVFNELIGIGADGLSAYSSILARVTGDEKALKDAIATVMAVQSTANLVTKVANSLQSSSVIMLKVRKIQETAAATAINIKTAAETKGTVATKAATVAQAAFNAVAKANPYVLLATAVLAAGAALYTFMHNSNEATEAEKEQSEAAKKAADEWTNFKDQVSNSGASLLQTYSKLREEWKNLKSAHEKTQWLKDNKEAFNKLGVEVKGVGDAENFLNNQTATVVEAFMQRAKAAAYAALAVEKYKDVIQKELEFDNKKVKEGDLVPDWYKPTSVTRDNNGKGNTANEGRFYVNNALSITGFTAKGAEEYNNQLKQQIGLTSDLTDEIENLTEASVDSQNEANKLLKNAGVNATSNSTKGAKGSKSIIKPEFESGSLAEMEEQLSKLKENYRKGWVIMDKQQYLSEVKRLEQKILNKRIELGLETEIHPGSIADIDKKINEKTHNLQLEVDDNVRKKLKEEIDDLTSQKAQIELKLSYTPGLIIKEGEINKTLEVINDEMDRYITEKYDLLEFPPDPTSGLGRWKRKAEDILRSINFYSPEIKFPTDSPIGGLSLADNIKLYEIYLNKLGELYDKFIEKLKDRKILTEGEADIMRKYIENVAQKRLVDEGHMMEGDLYGYKESVEAYEKLRKEKEGFTEFTDADKIVASMYFHVKYALEELQEQYKDATKDVYEFNRNAMISERAWDIYRTGMSSITGATGVISSLAQAFADLDGSELDEEFKKTISAIESVINGLDSLIQMYEKVNSIIKLFGEISELVAAKRVAASGAEAAADTANTAIDTTNTQTKLANTAAEVAAETAEIPVKEGAAIAGATASGAKLPFPANIAAIAAGIAAVVAAFAMISSFADGGIVAGGSYIGDSQLVRVNSNEMILNGSQQKRLFNILNGTGSRNGATVGNGGVVNFKIKGNNLYGVLSNHNSKQKRI